MTMMRSIPTTTTTTTRGLHCIVFCYLLLLLLLLKDNVTVAQWMIRPVAKQRRGDDGATTTTEATLDAFDRFSSQFQKQQQQHSSSSSDDDDVLIIRPSTSAGNKKKNEKDFDSYYYRQEWGIVMNPTTTTSSSSSGTSSSSSSSDALATSSRYTNPFVQIYYMFENYFVETLQTEIMNSAALLNTRHAESIMDGLVLAGTNVCNACMEGCKMAYECAKQGKVGTAVAVLPTMVIIGLKTGLKQLIQGAANPENSNQNNNNNNRDKKNQEEYSSSYYSTGGRKEVPSSSSSSYSLDAEDWELKQRLALEGDEEHRPPNLKKASSTSSTTTGSTTVKDPTYYELLDIPTHATKNEIKRAYYRLALEFHPDKNLGNERNSTKQFHQLTKAYQVLIRSSTRAKYDQEGIQQQQQTDDQERFFFNEFDIHNFFAVLMGVAHPLVQPYVGDLALGYLADELLEAKLDDDDDDDDIIMTTHNSKVTAPWELKQQRRVVDVALHFRTRIESFVMNNNETQSSVVEENIFREGVQKEAMKIAMDASPFGSLYLTLLGKSIKRQTRRKKITSPFYRTVEALQDAWKTLQSSLEISRMIKQTTTTTTTDDNDYNNKASSTDSSSSDSYLWSIFDTVSSSSSKNNNKKKNLLQQQLEIIWRLNENDISTTVADAIQKVLDDATNTKYNDDDITRQRRRQKTMEALNILGTVFETVGTEMHTTTTSDSSFLTVWIEQYEYAMSSSAATAAAEEEEEE